MKRKSESEWQLIDYMEDDLEESLKEDLARLLQNAPRERDVLLDLKAVRTIVAAADEVPVEDEARWDRMASRIMSEIERVELAPPDAHRRAPVASHFFVTMGLLTLLVMFVGLVWQGKGNLPFSAESELPVARQLSESPDWLLEGAMDGHPLVDTALEYRSREDLLQDQMISILDDMPETESEKLIENLKRRE